ncbi:hypothetical protein [Allopontixanthobacter sp.]|uniref:hypothetical protein n=1 Tax=Allopontixanthobacter sp. TaxID=2906452 RepID=UPI002ABAD717|nr:hypothetical protein [Allopontixanthobacter sp.]MDZ4307765.1 hypothetical protein [Allopontixanthobacter sp.]
MNRISLLSSSAGLMAALSLAATPAAAAEIRVPASPSATMAQNAWEAGSVTVNRDRYRGRYRGHRDHIDAGDVIGGLLVIGAIAAVASAVSKPREPRYPAPYPDRAGYNSNSGAARGIDRAADMCVREVERDARVGSVDAVERSGNGWRVSGVLFDGNGFTCRIGQDGRIDDVSYGDGSGYRGSSGQVDDRQWSDDRYADAWGNAGPAAPVPDYSGSEPGSSGPVPSGDAPAYPGGPVPGESYEDYPDNSGAQDDRYGD